jgi:hypothetical protein
MRCSRRRLLAGVASTATLGLVAPSAVWLSGCTSGGSLEAMLASFFDDAAAARAVGEVYLRETSATDDPAELVGRLAGGQENEWRRLAVDDPKALRERVRERHRDDCAAGRVKLLRGWVLSDTELSLCALAARLR